MAKRTYLYLARRDKKGIKILTVFPHAKDNAYTRIKDVKLLGLPNDFTATLEDVIHTDRMLWELFLECADSYGSLKEILQKRGYSNLPMHLTSLCPIEGHTDTNKQAQYPQPVTVGKSIKTMLRKKK
jgi:hypothetical protein